MSGSKEFFEGGQPLRVDDLGQLGSIINENRSLLTGIYNIGLLEGNFDSHNATWVDKPFYEYQPIETKHIFESGSFISLNGIGYPVKSTTDIEQNINIMVHTTPKYYIINGDTSCDYWEIYHSVITDNVVMYDLTTKNTFNDSISFILPVAVYGSGGVFTINIFDIRTNTYVPRTLTLVRGIYNTLLNYVPPFTRYDNINNLNDLMYSGLKTLINNDHYTITQSNSLNSSLSSSISTEASIRTNADQILTSAISSEVVNRTNAVSTEASLRTSVDSSIEAKLSDTTELTGSIDSRLNGLRWTNLPIMDWNMFLVTGFTVSTPILPFGNIANIRTVQVMINHDVVAKIVPLNSTTIGGVSNGGIVQIYVDGTDLKIQMYRSDTGEFNTQFYDRDNGFLRGWITICST